MNAILVLVWAWGGIAGGATEEGGGGGGREEVLYNYSNFSIPSGKTKYITGTCGGNICQSLLGVK